jgi:TolB-like protein/Flp pilus assembly protein TadD
MPGDSQAPLDRPAAPALSWWRRLGRALHSRFARQIALGAVIVGAIAATGHFVGGMIGWWHAYELTFGSHGATKTAAGSSGAKAPLLSIVVLPFANAGAAEETWFAENLTNDVAVELSRVPDSSVIGREAAARYRGREADPRDVARELGVRYVLAGSVERVGDKVRLRARLLDGESGAQRWAERFDVERAALPGLVDDLSRRLARAIDFEMVRSAGSAAARLSPEAAHADDLAMQGWATLYRGMNRQTVGEATALFERAVAMDPGSVRGWGGAAFASSVALRRSRADQAALRRLEQAADRLERLDPAGYYGILARGMLAFARRDWSSALAVGDRLIELFPGHHGSYTMRGSVLVRLGRFEEALADTEKAIALLPNNTDGANEWRRAFIFYGMGRYAEAAAGLRQALAKNPTSLANVFPLAAALVRSGKPDEARQVIDEARRQHADLSTAKVAELQFEGSGERFIATRDDMIAALREVGLQ